MKTKIMKRIVFLLSLLFAMHLQAQSYTGITDPSYRGAILYSQPNFQGTQQRLTYAGQSINFTARSIQVFGGYKVDVAISGNTTGYYTEDDANLGNAQSRTYTLRSHNQFYVAIIYSGSNYSGIAWYLPVNATFSPSTAGWSSHFPNGQHPRSIKILATGPYEADYFINGQNDHNYVCSGNYSVAQGIRQVIVRNNGCANYNANNSTNNNNNNNTSNTNNNNTGTNQGVILYGGPNQTGSYSHPYEAGTYTQVNPATIRSLRVPSGYVVRIKTYNRYNTRQRNKCYRITSTSTLPGNIGNNELEKITELTVCGPNASSLNCRCN